jgi:glucose/mannose transport system substrate-binding protein
MSLQAWLGKITSRAPHCACALCFACCALGCGAPTPAKVRLEVYSWWKRPSEQHAFDNILRLYNDAHSDSEAVNQVTDTNADAMRKTLTARLLAGAPPSTFQANIGADLLRWSVVDTTDAKLDSSSRILPLRDFFTQTKLSSFLPRVLNDALVGGPTREPYTVPVDIHRLNVLYYNTASLASFSIRNSGGSFLDRDVLCPPDVATRLADPKAKLDVRIAVSTADTFALTLLAFESVLPAVAGPQVYDDLFRGQASGEWQASVRPALQCVQYLSRSFVNEQETAIDWAGALAQVQTGTADLSIMGDWSNGELKSALANGEVDSVPFPGSEDTFVFTSDSFPLPVDAPYPEQTQALLQTIASPEGQLSFSRDKGSIPARSDIDVSALGARAVSTRKDFDDLSIAKVLATSGLFPPYFPNDEMNGALAALTQPGAADAEVEAVLALLKDTEPLLARWQSRLVGVPSSAP